LLEDFNSTSAGRIVSAGWVALFNHFMSVHQCFGPVDRPDSEEQEPSSNRETDKHVVVSGGRQVAGDDGEDEIESNCGYRHKPGEHEQQRDTAFGSAHSLFGFVRDTRVRGLEAGVLDSVRTRHSAARGDGDFGVGVRHGPNLSVNLVRFR
jgi:hypothetical protein